MKTIELTDQFVAHLPAGSGAIELTDQKKPSKEPSSILVKMEAVHSHVNANFVLYPPDKLRGDLEFTVNNVKMPTGAYSFTDPYPKPILVNHDHHDVKATVGRIERAYFSDKTAPGLPGVIVEARITDPDAIKAVLDGRYFTVSVGLSSDAAYCSICGSNWVDEPCDHSRGQEYDGRLAYWTSGNIWFKEVSFVNVPADRFAKVVWVASSSASSNASTAATSADAAAFESPFNFLGDFDSPHMNRTLALVSELEGSKEATALNQPENPELEIKDSEGNAIAVANDNEDAVASGNIILDAGSLFIKLSDGDDPKPLMEYFDEIINPIQAELDDAHARIQELESEVLALKEKLKAEDAEDEGDDKNDLKQGDKDQELKDVLAERVVDLRIALGKEGEVDREKIVASYRKKSLEYLTDSLADLTRELANSPAHRTIVSRSMVTSPGLAINSGANVYNVSDSEGTAKTSSSKLPDKYARLYEKNRGL